MINSPSGATLAVSTPLDITGIGWLRRQIFIKVADRISVSSPRLSVLSTERCAASLCDGQRSSNKCKVRRKHHHWGTRLNSAEASKPFLFRFMNIMLATRNAVFYRKFYRLVIKKDLSLITKNYPCHASQKKFKPPSRDKISTKTPWRLLLILRNTDRPNQLPGIVINPTKIPNKNHPPLSKSVVP